MCIVISHSQFERGMLFIMFYIRRDESWKNTPYKYVGKYYVVSFKRIFDKSIYVGTNIKPNKILKLLYLTENYQW